jgi:hypothetical protein
VFTAATGGHFFSTVEADVALVNAGPLVGVVVRVEDAGVDVVVTLLPPDELHATINTEHAITTTAPERPNNLTTHILRRFGALRHPN